MDPITPIPDDTPVSSSAPATPLPPPTGIRAIAAAATAIVGVLSAAFPKAPVLAAVNNAIPALHAAIPILVTAIGAIVAAWSHPPARPAK